MSWTDSRKKSGELRQRNAAGEDVGDEWAERDPVAGVAWLSDLPSGRGREEGMRSVVSEWVRRDPSASGEDLLGMLKFTLKNSSVIGYSQKVVRIDTEAAMIWAGSIGSRELRQETLARTARE